MAHWSGEGATWIKFLGTETREVLRAAIEEALRAGPARERPSVFRHLSPRRPPSASICCSTASLPTATTFPDKQPDVCPPGNMRIQADVDVNSPEVQATIRAIIQRGTPVASTLATYESFIPDHPLDARALDLLAADTRAEVESIHAGLARAGFHVEPRLLQKMMAWERAFVAAGGLLGAGVDPGERACFPELVICAITNCSCRRDLHRSSRSR